MTNFKSIEELLRMLSREKALLKDMFQNRKSISYSYEMAREMVDYKSDRLTFLIEHGVIRDNGDALELEEVYLQFFENVLDVVHFALSVAAFFTRTMQMAQSLLCNLRLAKASNTTRRTTPNDVVFFYPYLIQNWRFEVTVKENSKYCYMYYSTYLAHIALSTTHRHR